MEQEPNGLWVNQFDDKQDSELNFQFNEEAEYHDTITSFCLSHHGFIIAVGLYTGEIFCCDSRNFCNKHEYTTHKTEVTSISFSRDSLYIASGDKTGFFQIHNVVTGLVEYATSFPEPIKSIVCSEINPDIFLILLANSSLFLFKLSDKNYKKLDHKFSLIIWEKGSPNFISAFHNDVFFCQIDEKNSRISIVNNPDLSDVKIKEITSITISNNKKILIIIDSRGIGYIYSLSFGCILGSYSDSVNRSKYSFSAFSNDDNYIFMVSKIISSMTFATYSNGDAFDTTPVYSFKGLKEQVRQIIPHPIYPIIFVRLKYQIYTWTYYSRAPLYNSVPEKNLMRKNAEYCERESEFDSSDDDDEENSIKYKPLKLMKREPEGVLNIFPDDINFPKQIYFLPYQHENITNNT